MNKTPQPSQTEINLNYDLFKSQAELYKTTTINMARAALKQLPREDLIEMLVKKKIIQRDWSQKGNKYKLRKNG